MRADEVNGEIFVFVGCYEAVCIIFLGADLELVEEEGEYTRVVISVSAVSAPNIISNAKYDDKQGKSEEIGLDGVGWGRTGKVTSCNMYCTIPRAVPWEYNFLLRLSGRTRKCNVSKQKPCYCVHNPHEHIFSYNVKTCQSDG